MNRTANPILFDLWLRALRAGFSEADAWEWAEREYKARFTRKDPSEKELSS